MSSCPEVLIVGAGPHALTAAAYLLTADPGLAGRIAVADPQPWLFAWKQRLAALRLDVLRSACVHHPQPRPYALLEFAAAHGRDGELTGDSGQPTVALFADFCAALVDRWDLERARIPAAVTGLHPRTDGRVDVELGQVRLRVNHVVLANNPARAHVPLLGGRHTDTLDLATLGRLRDLCVVGGGLTAGHLALHLARAGARVHLVTRRPLQAQPMDVDPVWLGHALPEYLTRALPARAAQLSAARAGSVPAATLRALQDCERVQLHPGRAVSSIGVVGHWRTVHLAAGDLDNAGHLDSAFDQGRAGGPALLVDDVWLATGQRLDVRFDPLTARLLAEVPVGIVDGLPALDPTLSWGGTAIHVTGGLTGLQTGPAARNLAGARIAAERSTPCVAGRHARPTEYPVGAAPDRPCDPTDLASTLAQ